MSYTETKVQIYYLKLKMKLLDECIVSEPLEVDKIKLYRKRREIEKDIKKLGKQLRKEKRQ